MRALIVSELRQRIRGKRWWILLALWTVVLFGILYLVRSAAHAQIRSIQSFAPGDARGIELGPTMFGSLMLLTLILACLVVPALLSTSINGERDRGTLAVLQATLLGPWHIALAKFVAAIVVTTAFLAATLPLTLWCFVEGGLGAGRVAITYGVMLIVCAVLLAVGLAASTLVRRPALSAVMSYAVVFALSLGTLIVFGLSLLSAPTEEVQVNVPNGQDFTTTQQVTGWRWLLLAPNPFVVLADAAPRSTEVRLFDPLQGIRDGVRSLRRGPQPFFVVLAEEADPPAVWPAGMAIELAIAAGAAAVTVRRLRIPARRLAPGQRVA